MEISITHELIYQYSKPVYLEPQIIYLTPRWSYYRGIKDFTIEIFPDPSLMAANLDVEGNLQNIAHFSEMTDTFKVRSSFLSYAEQWNPFEFIVYPFEEQSVPLKYSDSVLLSLSPYLKQIGDERMVKEYCEKIFGNKNVPILDFLNTLANAISVEFSYAYREEGDAMLPEELLKVKTGTCRDFSNLFMQVCRQNGIAARFVSGYFHGDANQSCHLHGWVEVYIPGGGWRGVDPTQGVMADERYIALAASADTNKVAPVSGNFRGDAKAELNTSLVINEAGID
ncbi:MAG: transglutaminase family protein [Chitinophagales bacterium]|nr:transglutaminase family protein [Chitinophagales bacterium]